MNHFIQQSHRGRPLLLVALLVAAAGAAKAQVAPPPNAGTVGVRINALYPFTTYTTNTDVTMYVNTTASAGAVDAKVDTQKEFIYDGTTYGIGISTVSVPKNTNLGRGIGSNHTIRPPLPGYWTAKSTASISAPATTTVTTADQVGFTVYFGG